MLHGCHQTPDEFAIATRMNALAEQRAFYAAYPAQSESANPARCWNWFDASHQRRDRGEPAFVAGLVNHLLRSHCIDDRRVYVAGLSAGGAMAVVLGQLYPDLFAAVGVHSGLPYAAAHDLRSALAAMKGEHAGASGSPACRLHRVASTHVPTIVFHGDRDAIVHPRNGLAIAEQTAATGVSSVERRTVAAGAEASSETRGDWIRRGYTRTRFVSDVAEVLAEQWLVHGSGHAWSGGDPGVAYTDPEGPDASEAMIRFFFSHTLRSPPGVRRNEFASPPAAPFAPPKAA
jgi:poly(hydroxyalkanoate) depolymerase family esterase